MCVSLSVFFLSVCVYIHILTGEFGVVYKARLGLSKREVAVKTLKGYLKACFCPFTVKVSMSDSAIPSPSLFLQVTLTRQRWTSLWRRV